MGTDVKHFHDSGDGTGMAEHTSAEAPGFQFLEFRAMLHE
jgi:hypothetical protein